MQNKKKSSLGEPLISMGTVTITNTEPGTIVADFDTLLHFFATHEVQATAKTHLLPLDIIPKLNSLLLKPADIRFKRPQLKSYPHVKSIFWLLRGSGLLRVKRIDEQVIFQVDLEKNTIWQRLNPVEKYFYLLELWWFRCSKELIAEDHGWVDRQVIFDLQNFWRNFTTKQDMTFKRIEEYQNLIYFCGNHNIALHHLFGLLDIEAFPPQAGTGWTLKRIALTKWGQLIIATVAKTMSQNILEASADIFSFGERPGLFHSLFSQYFPNWKFIDFPKAPQATMKGTLIFKVSLLKWSASIAIASSNSWEDLSDLILTAVSFDDTMHLYDFEIIDDAGTHKRFIHPEAEKMNSSDQYAYTEIGKMPIEKGQEITYTFDYGDNWQFRLVLEDIRDETIQKPKIVDIKGTTPEQYPFTDE